VALGQRPEIATVELVEAVGVDRQAFTGETNVSHGDGRRCGREVTDPPEPEHRSRGAAHGA